jgi:hypothetical protein
MFLVLIVPYSNDSAAFVILCDDVFIYGSYFYAARVHTFVIMIRVVEKSAWTYDTCGKSSSPQGTTGYDVAKNAVAVRPR